MPLGAGKQVLGATRSPSSPRASKNCGESARTSRTQILRASLPIIGGLTPHYPNYFDCPLRVQRGVQEKVQLMNMKLSIYLSLAASCSLMACGEAASTSDPVGGGTTSASSSSSTATMPSSATSSSALSSSTQSSASSSNPTTSPQRSDESSDPQGGSDTSALDETSSGGGRPRPPWLDSSETTTAEGETSTGSTAESSDESSNGETAQPPSSEEPVGEDPLAAAARCSSEMYWERGENDRMRPGEACITCHTAENEGPRYAIAGTLFPTGHEPNDCNGISGQASGAKVVITDADGQEHELTPNSVGNFFFNGNVPKPYTAKVVSGASERLMVTPQQDGDCNKCHTAEGSGGAPGRVVVPF